MPSLMKISSIALWGVALAAPTTTVKLNNGIEMPLVALGTWQYDNETAADAIGLGLPLVRAVLDRLTHVLRTHGRFTVEHVCCPP